MYHENEVWKKKNSLNHFDVTMCSYNEAEVSELVGRLVLSTLANSIPKRNSGLYRDDGQKTDRIIKDVTEMFKEIDLKIEIKTKLKVINFLDTTFNLSNGTYKPYRKPSNNLLNVNTSFNHLPQIIK